MFSHYDRTDWIANAIGVTIMAGWAGLTLLVTPATDLDTGIRLLDYVLVFVFIGFIVLGAGLAVVSFGMLFAIPYVAWRWLRRAKRIFDAHERDYDEDGYRRFVDDEGFDYYGDAEYPRYVLGTVGYSLVRSVIVCGWVDRNGDLVLRDRAGHHLSERAAQKARNLVEVDDLPDGARRTGE